MRIPTWCVVGIAVMGVVLTVGMRGNQPTRVRASGVRTGRTTAMQWSAPAAVEITGTATSIPVPSSDCSVRTTYANLSGCDLHGQDLSGLTLTGTDFRNANLTDANLTGAFLWNTNWSGADLTRANLTQAEFNDAVMIGVDLRTANLGSIYPVTLFYRTDLRNANLQGVVATASYWYADLRGANMQNGIFETVRYPDMRGANLTNATFKRLDYINSFTWGTTTCPDGSNSDDHAGTCVGYMTLQQTNTPSLTYTPSKTFTPSRTPTFTTSLTPSTTLTRWQVVIVVCVPKTATYRAVICMG